MSAAAPHEDSGGAAAFPWAEAMRIGLGQMGLAPRDFWAMSPREFACLLGGGRSPAAPGRAGLDELMRRFPDEAR